MRSFGLSFRAYKPGDVITNNMLPSLFNKDPVRHLVNEASQNSLDSARALGMRARLTFWLRRLPRLALEPFGVSEIERHAAACSEHDIAKSLPADTVRVLSFEDESGGVEGDPRAGADFSTPLGRYTFSVGSGVTGKAGQDNGRHGLGSGSGAIVSKVRSMYFTSTRVDGSTIGSGRTSLATHMIDGDYYQSEARLGAFEDGEWKGILQDDDADILHLELGFSRPLDVPGLSCAVIDPLDGINGYSLVAGILAWQFLQVARGEIEFRVRDEESGIDVVISAETIDAVISSELFGATRHAVRNKGKPGLLQSVLEDLPAILGFVRSQPAADTFQSVAADGVQAAVPALRDSWFDGRGVGVSLDVSGVHSVSGPVSGAVTTWVRPLKPGNSGYDVHVRDSIVNVRKAPGRFSLTTSAGDGCSVLLGDSEDPSHMTYTQPYARKRGWSRFAEVIGTFKDAPAILQAAMSGDASKGDRVSLARFFPMPGSGLRSRIDGGVPDDEADDGGPVVVDGETVVDDIFSHKIDRRTSCVTLTLTAAAQAACEEGALANLVMKAEYAGSKPGLGSFTDTSTTFTVERGAESHAVSGNELTLYGVSPDLRIVIGNVDLNRDLRIVNDLADMEEAA